MKKLISLLCVITLLLSQFVVASAHSGCTADTSRSPIEKTALITADSKNSANKYYVYLSGQTSNRALLLLELKLDNLWNIINMSDAKKGVANFKYAGLSIYNYYDSTAKPLTAAIYEVDNFDWSGYDKDTINFITYTGEENLPFNKETDLINTFTVNAARAEGNIADWIEQKLIEGKTSVTIALDNITTEHTNRIMVGRNDYSGAGFHPYLTHRRVYWDTPYNLRAGNFNTTITDGYLFSDEDGTNYVFAKYTLGNAKAQTVTDLGIQIGDTFYSLKKDGDTTEFDKALTSKCFGIGIKDLGKTLGDSYLAIPQVKMKDLVKDNTDNSTYIDDGFVKSGAGVTVTQ